MSDCAPEVIHAIQRAKAILESLGGSAIETTLEHNKIYLPTYYIIATAEASSNLARFDGVRYGFRAQTAEGEDMTTATRSQGFGPEVQRRIMLGTFVLSSGYYDAYYSKALRARQAISEFYNDLFNKADIFLLPTSADIAFKFGEKSQDPIAMYLTDIFTVTANIAGIPAISVPAGTGKEQMPISVQLQAAYGNDELLMRITHRLQEELKK
jgi:aspartyl-tRNA(Asn)/glutamyl-tRNA(Gln) amidotransferase subunit A